MPTPPVSAVPPLNVTSCVLRGCLEVFAAAAALAQLREVAHDVNNPLGAAYANLSHLAHAARQPGPPAPTQFSTVADAASDGLLALDLARKVLTGSLQRCAVSRAMSEGPGASLHAVVHAVSTLLAAPPAVAVFPEGTLSPSQVAVWGPLLLVMLQGGEAASAALEIQRRGDGWQLEARHSVEVAPPPLLRLAAEELVQSQLGTMERHVPVEGGARWTAWLPDPA